jgi:hypothetical protein
MELLETIKTLDTPSALRTLADHDVRAFGSPQMAAIVEHALRNWDESYESRVTPHISPVATGDGHAMTTRHYLATCEELERNWADMLAHFGLSHIDYPYAADYRHLGKSWDLFLDNA